MKPLVKQTLGALALLSISALSTVSASDIMLVDGQFMVAKQQTAYATLIVKGPGNFQFISENGKEQYRPKSSIDPKSLVDGYYTYEIREFNLGSNRTVTDLANGRYKVRKRNTDNEQVRFGKVLIKSGEIMMVDSFAKEG